MTLRTPRRRQATGEKLPLDGAGAISANMYVTAACGCYQEQAGAMAFGTSEVVVI